MCSVTLAESRWWCALGLSQQAPWPSRVGGARRPIAEFRFQGRFVLGGVWFLEEFCFRRSVVQDVCSATLAESRSWCASASCLLKLRIVSSCACARASTSVQETTQRCCLSNGSLSPSPPVCPVRCKCRQRNQPARGEASRHRVLCPHRRHGGCCLPGRRAYASLGAGLPWKGDGGESESRGVPR